jgi:hypothetical protein
MEKTEKNNIPHLNIILANTKCERTFNKMFNLTLIPIIKSKNKFLKFVVPFLTCSILFSAMFCILFYPSYYPSQGEVWTTDIVIGFIIYSYLLYQQKRWDLVRCDEYIEIPKWSNNLSFTFYIFLILYWFYYAIIQFTTHNEQKVSTQLLNVLMSTAWYLFFSVMASIYYFICTKLFQRAENIKFFLKNLKKTRPSIDYFYTKYDEQHRQIKIFARYWNFLIFFGFLLLTFHVPIDLMSIIYQRVYVDIPGFIIKLLALAWYTYNICHLNNYETKIIPYLYKHKIYDVDKIEEIEKYIEYRKIGLNFYGIKMNGGLIIKGGLILINLVIPTLYAIFSNKIGLPSTDN